MPALPPHQFLNPQKHSRQIRSTRNQDYITTNIISGYARNNTRAYAVPSCRTEQRKNSFFPRTTRDWNQLDNTIVYAPSLEAFKSSCQSTSIDFLCNARLRCVNARQLDVAAYYYIYRQTDTGYPCLLQMTVTLTFE